MSSDDAAEAGGGPPVEPGQVWVRQRGSAAVVRRVRAVAGGIVHYEVLHGPASLRRNRLASCNLRSFLRHARQVEEQADYSHFDGARRFDTFLVLSTGGGALLRCGRKRANFYLKKGYVRRVAGGVLQFTDDRTEKTLAELYRRQ